MLRQVTCIPFKNKFTEKQFKKSENVRKLHKLSRLRFDCDSVTTCQNKIDVAIDFMDAWMSRANKTHRPQVYLFHYRKAAAPVVLLTP
jgi:hypothetical protein